MQVKQTNMRIHKPGVARVAQYPHVVSDFNKELA